MACKVTRDCDQTTPDRPALPEYIIKVLRDEDRLDCVDLGRIYMQYLADEVLRYHTRCEIQTLINGVDPDVDAAARACLDADLQTGVAALADLIEQRLAGDGAYGRQPVVVGLRIIGRLRDAAPALGRWS